ncbi:O-antigen ligase family protein [Clostridium thermosuccinogenes]|nr:O-antigen ligase family protein [Pseudoclostridium thermosuccinogenes]
MSQRKRESKSNNIKNKNAFSKAYGKIDRISIAAKLKTIIILCLSLILFYPPFLRGLFFDTEQLFTEIFVLSVYLLFWIYKYLLKNRRILTTPIDYAALGFVFVYFLSLFPAIDKYLAISEWLKYCMYFAIFHMVSEIAITYRSKAVLLWTMAATACSVSIIGLDALAGGKFVGVLNSLSSKIGLTQALGLKEMFFMLTAGNRISSTFQYPNALASYNMAVFFITVGLIITSRHFWTRAIGGCAGFVLFVTFFLTSSRGAYLMFPVAGLIFIMTLPKGDRLKGLFYSIIYSLIGAALSFKLLEVVAIGKGNYYSFWKYILLGVLVSSVLTIGMYYIVKFLEKLSWKVYAVLVSILIITAVSGLIYALNTTLPVELSNMDAGSNNLKSVRRSVVLKPGHQYKLTFNVEASMKDEKPYAYYVNVQSLSVNDILFDRATYLGSLSGQATNGINSEEISFKVPEDSKIIRLNFINYHQDTKAVFSDAVIQDASSGKIVKKVPLKYKYIPESLASRLDDIWATKSGIQRLVYYKDGWEIIKDRPILGAGGGAWSLLYFMYQSYLYFSTQAHNYFLQLGVETGIVGLLALLVLILSIVFMYTLELKYTGENTGDKVLQSAAFTSICALFMHSFIDFDFSLAAVFMLAWALLGIYNSRYINTDSSKTKLDSLKNKLYRGLVTLAEKLENIKKVSFSPVIGTILTALILLLPVLFLTAKGYAKDSIIARYENDQVTALKSIKSASLLNPFNVEYKIEWANVIINKGNVTQKELKEAYKLLTEAEKKSKFDVRSHANIGSLYLAIGNIEKGLEHFDFATKLKPLDPSVWETRIDAYSSVINYFINNDALENAYKYMNGVQKILVEAKEANNKNLDPFIFSDLNIFEKIEEYKHISATMDYKQDSNINGSVINSVIDRFIFINYPELDINSDGLPDQWVIGDPTATKVYIEDGMMVVDSTKNGYGYITSRKLNLEAEKSYTIVVEITNPETIEKIEYNLTGVSQENGILEKSGSKFLANITVPSDFEPGNNVLRLWFPEKVIIGDIKIYRD